MHTPVSVVIPCYNEQEGITQVIAEVRSALAPSGRAVEIIVVDDGSTDQSARAALQAGVRVLRHRSNRGYGAALKTGISAASHSLTVIMDGDSTYPAEAIPPLLDRLGQADMVVGARRLSGANIPLLRRPAKWFLNRLANFMVSARIPDLNSGLRAFRRDIVLQYFPILPDQFSWTTTITLAMHCDKYAVAYLPIEYRARKGSSKIVPWDAYNFLMLILRTAMLFRPLRVFLPLIIIFLAYGFVKMALDLMHQPNISASALLAFLSALQLLLTGMIGDAIAARLSRISPPASGVARGDEVVEESLEG
ncbi:MAG: glycosyltransferase family 2 protein [Acidobacteria bacterium]|nr:glycosyltransferase family 2 protein [Acidobacteriota bacterium]